jgi:hypothetical protein
MGGGLKAGRAGLSEKFYESDCQGRFSSLLIAFSSAPSQSAHSDLRGTSASARGWAVQSYASDSSSMLSIGSFLETIASGLSIVRDVDHGSI